MLPWYRKPSCKGKMSEAEKRTLDSFRMKDKHPSATQDHLPEEVKSYINRLEFELYDLKQDQLVGQTLAASPELHYSMSTISVYLIQRPGPMFSARCLIVPWFFYRHEWKKNAEEFLPRRVHTPAGMGVELSLWHPTRLNSFHAHSTRKLTGKVSPWLRSFAPAVVRGVRKEGSAVISTNRTVRIKRVYEAPEASDGFRVLRRQGVAARHGERKGGRRSLDEGDRAFYRTQKMVRASARALAGVSQPLCRRTRGQTVAAR